MHRNTSSGKQPDPASARPRNPVTGADQSRERTAVVSKIKGEGQQAPGHFERTDNDPAFQIQGDASPDFLAFVRQSLEHAPNPDAPLTNLHRKMQSGGR